MSAPLRVLLTNDDGPHSAGLGILARELRLLGWPTAVVVPSAEVSGCGTTVVPLAGNPGTSVDPSTAYTGIATVQLPPALIVVAAIDGWFGLGGPPDLVVSGPNRGPNVGTGIVHSGTFGAAMAGACRGVRSFAASLDDRYSTGGVEDGVPHWEECVSRIRETIIASIGDAALLYNINVPDLPAERIEGVHWTTPAAPVSSLVAGGSLGMAPSSFFRPTYDLSQAGEDSDIAALTGRYVSVSRLTPLTVEPTTAVTAITTT